MGVQEELSILAEIGLLDKSGIQIQHKIKQLTHKSEQAALLAAAENERAAQLKKTKNELLLARKTADGKLMEEKANLRKWEARADRIRGEREYTALISEINTLKRSISDYESQISETVSKLDSTDKELKAAEEKAQSQSALSAQEAEAVAAQKQDAEQEFAETQTARQGLLAQLPRSLIARYEKIKSKRGNVAVAWLKKEVCQACMRSIPPELYYRIARNEIVESCPSCQRILVCDEAKAPADKHSEMR